MESLRNWYESNSVPREIVNDIDQFNNSEIIFKKETDDRLGQFWRFYPASDRDVEIMLSRDCDSRLNQREKEAVNEWLNSSKSFHIMRDHPYHNTEILAGMWGVKNPILNDMQIMINEYLREGIMILKGTEGQPSGYAQN